MKTWYVYHIIDPTTNKVFYIGKGHGRRYSIHMTRALKWRKDDIIIPGGNRHLYNKLLKIYDSGLQPKYSIEFESNVEKEALDREIIDIAKFGIENLCNLTYGGEGETRTKESLEKLSKSLRKFWDSEDGYIMRESFSKERIGENNPMWGNIEDENHKIERMKNLLVKEKWNKGLKGDSRCKGFTKGNIPTNALKCSLINEDGRTIDASSLKELSKLSGVPLVSINRMRTGKKNKKGWKLIIIS